MANHQGLICWKQRERAERDRCQHSSMTTALDTPSAKPQKLRRAHRFPSLLGLSYRKTVLSAANKANQGLASHGGSELISVFAEC